MAHSLLTPLYKGQFQLELPLRMVEEEACYAPNKITNHQPHFGWRSPQGLRYPQ